MSDNQIISSTRLSGEFSRDVVASQIFGFTRPVLYVLIIMVVLGLFLEQMQVGRFLYAVGFNAPGRRGWRASARSPSSSWRFSSVG